jgi:hypothetical protein
MQGRHQYALIGVLLREVTLEARRNRGDLRTRLVDRDPITQAADGSDEMAAAVRRHGIELVGHEHVGVTLGTGLDVAKRFAQDADDQRWSSVDIDRSADNRGVAAVASLPEAVTQDRNPRAVHRVFLGREAAADGELRAEDREQPVGDVYSADPLRHPCVIGNREVADPAVRAHPHQRSALACEVEEIGGRQIPDLAGFAIDADDAHQRVRVGIWQRPQQHRTDDGEHRGVGADSKRERDHGDGGKGRSAEQRAPCKAEILAEHADWMQKSRRGLARSTGDQQKTPRADDQSSRRAAAVLLLRRHAHGVIGPADVEIDAVDSVEIRRVVAGVAATTARRRRGKLRIEDLRNLVAHVFEVRANYTVSASWPR